MRVVCMCIFIMCTATHHLHSIDKHESSRHNHMHRDTTDSVFIETTDHTCVVSVVTGPKYKQYAQRLINNKQNYCTEVGYKCHIFNNTLIAEKRPLAWQKVYAIQAVLHNDRCKRLLWLDADCIIMHPQKLPNTTRNIALTIDYNNINTGVMIIKNTAWSKTFFGRVSSTTRFDFHPWWEQAAIIHFVETEESVRQNVEYIKQNDVNSYDMKNAPFIYHSAGCAARFHEKVRPHCWSLWDDALRK